MLRCDATGKLLPPKLVKPSDQVAITKGSFANFVAEVEEIAPTATSGCCWILGCQTRVAVGPEQLWVV